MNPVSVIVLIFSALGALDYLFGNKLGLGQELEKAFTLFRAMFLSMVGVLTVAPALGQWLMPLFDGFYHLFGLDPSIIPASLLANDMGGMTLAQAICKTEAVGNYNAYVVSALMGVVISFTIPVGISMVKPQQHKDLFFGFLCGIVAVPIGGFVAGLMCGLTPLQIILNLLPLMVLSGIIAVGLLLAPKLSVRIFAGFGRFMRAVSVIGLILAVFTFLTGVKIHPAFAPLEDSAMICVNACVTLSGMLPLMAIVTKLLRKPAQRLGEKMGINDVATVSFLASSVSVTTIFGSMEKMDRRGVVLNAAFSVSGAFVFGSHLAFTMAFDSSYLTPMMVGKLLCGVSAVALAMLLYKDKKGANA